MRRVGEGDGVRGRRRKLVLCLVSKYGEGRLDEKSILGWSSCPTTVK